MYKAGMVGKLSGKSVVGALIGVFFCMSAGSVAAATNLVSNGDFETPSSNASIPAEWNKNNWGTLTATFAYPVTGFENSKAARVTVSNRSSGDAKWWFTELPAIAGDTYTYTNRYIATVQTEVTVQFKMQNGSYQYKWLGSVPASSSWKTYTGTVTPPSGAVAFTVFHLISRNGSLTIDTVSVTNNSSTPPPPPPPTPTCTFTATPTIVQAGSQSTLSWTTTNASSTSINNGVGSVATTTGSVAVSPTQTTSYTLTATGAGGSKTCTATVTVEQPTPQPAPTCTLTASPATITEGATSTLSWTTTNASSTSINNGIGAVATSSGTRVVTPTQTATYTLSAIGGGGNKTCDATVTVSSLPPPPPPPGNNLVANGTFETSSSNASMPAEWNNNFWGTLQAVFAYPVAGKDSAKAARVTVSNYQSGDAKWWFPHIPATPGSKYTYSNNYMSAVATEATAEFKMQNGSYQYEWLGTIPAQTNWGTYTTQVTIPTGAVSFTVFHLLNKNGSLTIDNVQVIAASSTPQPPVPPPAPTCTLSASPVSIIEGAQSTLSWTTTNASSTSINNNIGSVALQGSLAVEPATTTTYILTATGSGGTQTCTVTVTVTEDTPPPPPPPTGNLVENGDFEIASNNAAIPANWNTNYWGSMTPTFSYPVTGNSGKAARVTVANYRSGDAKWWFTHIPASSDIVYRYSNTYLATAQTNVTVEFKMANGTYQYQWLADLPAQSQWTPFTTQITVPTGAVSFTVFHVLNRNGSLTIDNVSVVAPTTGSFTEGMITLVFDDALASQYNNARPILNAANIDGVFGVVTGYVGTNPYVSWSNLTTLDSEGHEIAGHSRTHANLTTLTAAQLTSETKGSYDDLVAQGFTPKSFLYPVGATNTTVEAAVKDAGYIGSRSSYYGLNTPDTNRYALYDIRLDQTSTLTGAQAAIDQAVATKRWVIFELHDVLTSGGDELSITPAFLQSVVDYIKEKGIKTVTLEEGLGLMNP